MLRIIFIALLFSHSTSQATEPKIKHPTCILRVPEQIFRWNNSSEWPFQYTPLVLEVANQKGYKVDLIPEGGKEVFHRDPHELSLTWNLRVSQDQSISLNHGASYIQSVQAIFCLKQVATKKEDSNEVQYLILASGNATDHAEIKYVEKLVKVEKKHPKRPQHWRMFYSLNCCTTEIMEDDKEIQEVEELFREANIEEALKKALDTLPLCELEQAIETE